MTLFWRSKSCQSNIRSQNKLSPSCGRSKYSLLKVLAVACKDAGISEQSYYRWKKEYGSLKIDQDKKLKELERENARLKKIVADLSLEKTMLKEVASGNW